MTVARLNPGLPAALLVALSWVPGCSARSTPRAVTSAGQPAVSAEQLHRDIVVADAHSDAVLWLEAGIIDLGRRNAVGQTDLPRLTAGGVDVVVFNLWADPLYIERGQAVARTRHMIDVWRATVARHQERIQIATTSAELKRIVAGGRIAAIGKIEGGHSLGGDLAQLGEYRRLGVSILGLTWQNSNELGDSCCDRPLWGGLSEFGERVVTEANRLGVVIDTAHASDATAMAAAARSTKPIICSHTAVGALAQHRRAVSDDVIRAIARTGGVVHIAAVNYLISPRWNDAIKRFRAAHAVELARIREQYRDDWVRRTVALNRFYDRSDHAIQAPPPTIEQLIDHIDYVVDLVGVDHVGIGTDFDGLPRHSFPRDLQDYSDFPELTRALQRRGYRRDEIAKIMGGNFLRVFAAVTAP